MPQTNRPAAHQSVDLDSHDAFRINLAAEIAAGLVQAGFFTTEIDGDQLTFQPRPRTLARTALEITDALIAAALD